MTETSPIGSEDRPLKVAIVGSGPSGFYAADALFRTAGLHVDVDMFDRLPTPFGLVRYGVAPDHQKIKAVTKVYDRIAGHDRFRFFGHVHVGRDITVEELRGHYHHVVIAVGCESDKKLGIPGEDLSGSHTATEFVAWYNGHPDFRDLDFDLSARRVAVVGVGNVAMDVTRVLLRDRKELGETDIANHALEALSKAGVEEVLLLGRRGPIQAAFSPKEIREVSELKGVDLILRHEDMTFDEETEKQLEGAPQDAQKNVASLKETFEKGPSGHPKSTRILFYTSPVEILGQDGKVSAVKLERNEIVNKDGYLAAVGTGKYETIEVGLVFRSVGYYGIPVPGLPFDDRKGVIPNREGRIINPEDGSPLKGLYAVGWIKRGPTGLIGTNKADSAATVKSMVEDVGTLDSAETHDRSNDAISKLLESRGVRWVSFQEWQRLDQWEVEQGKNEGKVRVKIPSIDGMLSRIDSTH